MRKRAQPRASRHALAHTNTGKDISAYVHTHAHARCADPHTRTPIRAAHSHGVGHKSKELPPLRGVGILKAGTPLALPLPTDASEGTDTDGDTGADARPTTDVSVDASARAQLSPAHALAGMLSSGSNASTPAKTPSRKRTGFVPERNMTVL